MAWNVSSDDKQSTVLRERFDITTHIPMSTYVQYHRGEERRDSQMGGVGWRWWVNRGWGGGGLVYIHTYVVEWYTGEREVARKCI